MSHILYRNIMGACVVAYAALFLAFAPVVFAQTSGAVSGDTVKSGTKYVPLAPLPGITSSKDTSLGSYVGSVFKLLIGLAGVFAVLVGVAAGIQYIGSFASESGKGDAKKRMTNVGWGILFLLSSWLILNTVNPDLLRLGFKIPEAKFPVSSSSGESTEDRVPGKVYPASWPGSNLHPSTARPEYNSLAECNAAEGASGCEVFNPPQKSDLLERCLEQKKRITQQTVDCSKYSD